MATNLIPGEQQSTKPPSAETPTKVSSISARHSIHLEPGVRPLPDYELVRPLGRGGFGEVWEARGPGGFPVALKFVRLDEQPGSVELRGLEVIKDIHHSQLLGTFGAWNQGDLLIIAMELGERTLNDLLKEAQSKSQVGIPIAELIEYMRDAAKGIDHLNALGIQHRDIKPQNLLLVGGTVKVADFGLVKLLEHSLSASSGSMTPAYASPEVLDGKTGSHSDQYSLAVTYCQLRGGRLPFEGNPAHVMAGHLMEKPDLTMLPEGERPAVARALAKSPENRWPSCREFVETLAHASVAPEAPALKTRSRKVLLAAVALLLVAAGALALLVVLTWTTPPILRLEAPDEITVTAGSSAVLELRLQRDHCPGAVEAVLEGLPAGVSSSPTAAPGEQTQMRLEVKAAADANPGTQTIYLRVHRGVVKADQRMTLIVKPATVAAKPPVDPPPVAKPPVERTPPVVKPPVEPPPVVKPPVERTPPVVKPPVEPTPPDPQPTPHKPMPGREIYRATLRGTAFIIVSLKNGRGTGTGWVIDRKDKLIVTNHHVIDESPRILALFPLYDTEGIVRSDRADYREENGYRCRIIHFDKQKDLALIQVTDPWPEGAAELKLAAASPEPGERVHAVGNPGASGALWVYTSGTVRAVYQKTWYSRSGRNSIDHLARVVETQAPINPGDSGGPIVNDDGELIGVNSHYQVFDGGGKDVRLMSHHIDVTEVKSFMTEARRIMQPKTAADYTTKGERLVERGRYDEAIEALTQAVKLDRACGAAYRQRSFAFCYKGDHDTAILDATAAIAINADDAEAYQCRALAQRRKGDLDKAIADYSKAIQLNPNYAIAYNNRGYAYSLKGDRKRALADYDQAIKSNKRYAIAYQNRAHILLELGRYQDCVQAAEEALSINPYLSAALEHRGRALHHLKQFDAAIANYDAAIKLFPNDPGFHVERGLALTWKDDWKSAIAEYEQALKIDPKFARAYYWLGSAFEHHSNIDKATENYQKVLNLDSKSYADKIKRETSCYINIKNNTKESIRVFLHVDAYDKEKGWGWYPTELGGDPIWIDIKPGQSITGLTWMAKEKDWKVHGRRIRIYAVGLETNAQWNRDKEKDIWLCPRDGYLARNRISATYTFHE